MAEIGIGMLGYAFMGKAHSHAWRNVAALRPGAPDVRQQVLVGRDADAVTVAAAAIAMHAWVRRHASLDDSGTWRG